MMVSGEVETAKSRNGVQLMVGSMRESLARSLQGAKEPVIGIVHAVASENRFETAFVKRLVVSHERIIFQERCYLLPHMGKHRRIIGVFARQPVYLGAVVGIKIGLRLYQRIKLTGENTVAHHDDADAANAGPVVIGGFKIDGSKILHGDGW